MSNRSSLERDLLFAKIRRSRGERYLEEARFIKFQEELAEKGLIVPDLWKIQLHFFKFHIQKIKEEQSDRFSSIFLLREYTEEMTDFDRFLARNWRWLYYDSEPVIIPTLSYAATLAKYMSEQEARSIIQKNKLKKQGEAEDLANKIIRDLEMRKRDMIEKVGMHPLREIQRVNRMIKKTKDLGFYRNTSRLTEAQIRLIEKSGIKIEKFLAHYELTWEKS
jgi:hypothetical protein